MFGGLPMSFSAKAKIGAGSKLYFENPAVPGVFLLLSNCLSFGATGEEGEFVESTPISEITKTYMRGMSTPPKKEFNFLDVPENENYQLYLALVNDKSVDSIAHRIDYSNGRRCTFSVVMNGNTLESAEGNTPLKMKVMGQQTGETVWSEF
jgi:hypothetical protein